MIRLSTTLATAGLLMLAALAPLAAQPTSLPGLSSPASVSFDSNGVPHVCAGSEADAMLLQGYLHARDRLFQMDTFRRTFSGNLGELLGPAAIAGDVQFRTLGLRRAAEATLEAMEAAGMSASLAALGAYAAGVNAYLAANPLPPEYAALELTQAAPWGVVDSLVVAKGVVFGLSFDLSDIDRTVLASAYAAAGQAQGFDGLTLLFEDTARFAPFDPTVSIGDGPAPSSAATSRSTSEPGHRPLAAPSARTAELASAYLAKVEAIEPLQRARRLAEALDAGSNWWLVAGSKSESGLPMLANDPHLGLDVPAIFYEIGLKTSGDCGDEGLNVAGVGFAGVPGIALGCNDWICWGATSNPLDVTDVYQEVVVLDPVSGLPAATLFDGGAERLVALTQTFRVNSIGDGLDDNLDEVSHGPTKGDVTFVVPRRNHGPIIQLDLGQDPPLALSVQYAGWGATFEVEALRQILHSSSVAGFRQALQFLDVGSQNWAYADIDGNIAYFTSGELPIREDLQNLGFPDGGTPPFLIRDGTHTLRHEWLPVQNPQPQQALGFEILPFAELPQTVNPQQGFILNANNDPLGLLVDNDPLNQLRPGGGLYYLAPGYADGLRAGRIRRLFEDRMAGGGTLKADDLEQMQADHHLLDAELLSPFLLDAFDTASASGAPPLLEALASDPGVAEAVNRLRDWDFGTPTGIPQGYDPNDDPGNLPSPTADEIASSVAATIWSAFRGQVVRDTVDRALDTTGLGGFSPSSSQAYNALAHHLQSFDTAQGVGASGVRILNLIPPLDAEQSRDFVLLANLRNALDLLASDSFAPAFAGSDDQDDYRWGYLHRIVFDHPLGGPHSVPPAAGFEHVANSLQGLARSGGYQTVDASGHSARADGLNEFRFGSGPARRFVGTLDPGGIRAEQILPGGQSGVLGLPHYASQLGRWLVNAYHPLLLSAEDIAGDSEATEHFEPLSESCQPGPSSLCLYDGRFRVETSWSAPLVGSGSGQVVPFFSGASGNFYFFDPENWEMLVKVLDGCSLNGHFWMFASAATDVSWELTVEDTASGEVWSAANPLGQRSPAIVDTRAFATCP